MLLTACGGGSTDTSTAQAVITAAESPTVEPTADDLTLQQLIDEQDLTGDPSVGRLLPAITDPLAQLGKHLFFSKSLGGGFDSACVTCHHPVLGGADGLSLSVGVAATAPDLLGPGRTHLDGVPPIPRNAPTAFNAGLWDLGMFWDSRVESLTGTPGDNGGDGNIRTPDSLFGVVDPNAGDNLAAAQARFPVTSAEEMRTEAFENGSSGDVVRAHLAARLGNYGAGAGELLVNNWLDTFQTAYASAEPAETLITFDNIAAAIGAYERSMVFVANPWRDYVQGDLEAISPAAKRGAILFLTPLPDNGAGCSRCHAGDFFSDERHHAIAFPQIDPGKGDGANGKHDFGRERETGNPLDRFRFRTPSLLNIAVSAPYTHAGAYATLDEVIRHYRNPRGAIDNYFAGAAWCGLQQFAVIPDCATLYPDAETNTRDALDTVEDRRLAGGGLLPDINLSNADIADLVAFLNALTDPCVLDRDCLAPWIADPTETGPDGQQLNAIDSSGELL
jgi:cytochrome c peroxidase